MNHRGGDIAPQPGQGRHIPTKLAKAGGGSSGKQFVCDFRNILGQEDVAASWCASHSDAAPHCPNNGVRHVNATDRRLLRRSGRLCSGCLNKPAERIPKSTGNVRTGGLQFRSCFRCHPLSGCQWAHQIENGCHGWFRQRLRLQPRSRRRVLCRIAEPFESPPIKKEAARVATTRPLKNRLACQA